MDRRRAAHIHCAYTPPALGCRDCARIPPVSPRELRDAPIRGVPAGRRPALLGGATTGRAVPAHRREPAVLRLVERAGTCPGSSCSSSPTGAWACSRRALAGRDFAVTLAVVLDLGLLALVKYLDWALGSTAGLMAWINGTQSGWQPLGIILPLAISFVTFTQIAYVVDIGRGGRAEYDTSVAMRCSCRSSRTSSPARSCAPTSSCPRCVSPRPLSAQFLRLALPLLVGGLLKKTIGDTLAPTANLVVQRPGQRGHPGRLGGRPRVRVPGTARLLGLHRHGARFGLAHGLPAAAELRLAVPLHEHRPSSGGAGT